MIVSPNLAKAQATTSRVCLITVSDGRTTNTSKWPARRAETPLARGVYLVGRSKTCQIRPKNRYVSRKHCAFIHKRQSLLIQDLGSRTGTYVNGERIEPSVALPLKDGDRIRVGKTRLLYLYANPMKYNSPPIRSLRTSIGITSRANG